jgi:CDP-paratose 2-epimerase
MVTVDTLHRVFHFAAQVAVTTSLIDPIADFEINARAHSISSRPFAALDNPPTLLFTSTNKVDGDLEDVPPGRNESRYTPADVESACRGISEARHLDFHSPYGCSKAPPSSTSSTMRGRFTWRPRCSG